jgi:hypothetical protein
MKILLKYVDHYPPYSRFLYYYHHFSFQLVQKGVPCSLVHNNPTLIGLRRVDRNLCICNSPYLRVRYGMKIRTFIDRSLFQMCVIPLTILLPNENHFEQNCNIFKHKRHWTNSKESSSCMPYLLQRFTCEPSNSSVN